MTVVENGWAVGGAMVEPGVRDVAEALPDVAIADLPRR